MKTSEEGILAAVAPRAGRRTLGFGSFVLLAIAALGFLLAPNSEDVHTSGTWYSVGWPFPISDVKIGYVVMPGPFGVYPHFNGYGLVDVVLWAVIFWVVWRLSGDKKVPPIVFTIIRFVIVLAAIAGVVFFAVGANQYLGTLRGH